jgi:hypothetical protein
MAQFGQSATNYEAQVWSLEKAYWEYVKANDLEKYRALWHEDFLGWPLVSPSPIGKEHITDWITVNTSTGLKLRRTRRTTRHSRDRRRRNQSLSNQNELGHKRNSQSADRRIAHYAHLDSHPWHVANHRRHVGSRKRRGQIVSSIVTRRLSVVTSPMAYVVFLRAVNVGKANRCRPKGFMDAGAHS